VSNSYQHITHQAKSWPLQMSCEKSIRGLAGISNHSANAIEMNANLPDRERSANSSGLLCCMLYGSMLYVVCCVAVCCVAVCCMAVWHYGSKGRERKRITGNYRDEGGGSGQRGAASVDSHIGLVSERRNLRYEWRPSCRNGLGFGRCLKM
jgi:hypothetical protein